MEQQNLEKGAFGSNHKHDFQISGNLLICSCGKKRLNLKNSKTINGDIEDNILIGTRSNGKLYTVRSDRHRYFFPYEWNKFINNINDKRTYMLFLTLLHTGARTMEAMHLRPINFNIERGTITLEVVKQRKAKRQFYAIGKTRTFFVSPKYIKEMKAYINREKIGDKEYIFLNNKDLPANYTELDNAQKKKYYKPTQTNYIQYFRRRMKESGIKDWKNFSLHNIRKTYGNWMRIYDIKTEEICYRLGHDIQTYVTHYGSPLIFTPQDKIQIMNILGEVK